MSLLKPIQLAPTLSEFEILQTFYIILILLKNIKDKFRIFFAIFFIFLECISKNWAKDRPTAWELIERK